MKISIISLRDKIITLEVHSPSVYRQISSIFKTDEEGEILIVSRPEKGLQRLIIKDNHWGLKNIVLI